jgi:sigma-B regulation protein RsbQ
MPESTSKPLCLLLPGMDGTGTFYTGLAEGLRHRFEVRILNYPKDQQLDYAGLCRHIWPELPADRDYVLIAESFAGPLSILLADAAVRKPLALILAATFAINPWPVSGPLLRILALLTDSLSPPLFLIQALLLGPETRGMAKDILTYIQKLGPQVLKSRLNSVLTCDVSRQLKELDLPILYLNGQNDRLIPPACGKKIAQLNPRVSIINIDAPHFVFQETPSMLIADILLPFIELRLIAPA